MRKPLHSPHGSNPATVVISPSQRQRAAQALLKAEARAVPVAPLSQRYAGIEARDAYAIQAMTLEEKVRLGARRCGHKIGLASPARRGTAGAPDPLRGRLLDTMFLPNGVTVDTARLIVPRVEIELAFVLGARVTGPHTDLAAILAATEYVTPALDVIDGRTQFPRTPIDAIADNDSAAAVVLGGRRISPKDVDLRWAGAILYRNRIAQESGVAGAILEHPAHSLVWLAESLATEGEALEPGDVLLAGAFARPMAVKLGDVVYADFGPLGAISLHFG